MICKWNGFNASFVGRRMLFRDIEERCQNDAKIMCVGAEE